MQALDIRYEKEIAELMQMGRTTVLGQVCTYISHIRLKDFPY
jgi:hypothetical protein